MRFIFVIIFFLLFDWYAFQAFLTISESWSSTSKYILYGLYWLFPLITIGTMIYAATSGFAAWNKEIFATLRGILVLAYFAKFLIVLVLLIDDIRRIAMDSYQAFAGGETFDRSRSKFLSQIAIFTGTLPFVMMSYGMFRNKYRYKIIKEIVKIDQLPKGLEGLKIVQISDIHSGSFTLKEPVKLAIEMINQQNADLVFFTGDLVNSMAEEMQPFMDIFDKIESKYGVYSITGNHDYGDYARWESLDAKKANFKEFMDTHKKLGWDLLMNENRMLEINGEQIAVIGVENYSAHPRFPKYGDLSKAHAGTETAVVKLLLSHDPSHWLDEVVGGFKDIDITFSGHTHGMQFGIEIPGLIKWSPIKYVYKQWAGLYESEKQYLYVNRGLGFLGYPGRVGILPEITVLELSRQS